MKTITSQFMLRFETVMGLNLGKNILMLSTNNLVKPTNTTLGTVILGHTHTHTHTKYWCNTNNLEHHTSLHIDIIPTKNRNLPPITKFSIIFIKPFRATTWQ